MQLSVDDTHYRVLVCSSQGGDLSEILENVRELKTLEDWKNKLPSI